MAEAIEVMRKRLPFPLLGINSDNDSAFINANLLRYCEGEKISVGASSPAPGPTKGMTRSTWRRACAEELGGGAPAHRG